VSVHRYDVLEFGAAGDGQTLDTRAIQSAIDVCHEAGGGTVWFSPGKYISGTIHIRSNVSLYLSADAVIQGSHNADDYDIDALANRADMPPSFSGGYLVYADNVENASILGMGCIDGQGRAFWTDYKPDGTTCAPKDKRPRAMIYMKNCRNLLFRDISLRCSPCFTLWLLGCDNVNIDGISIINPQDGPNTDGLDIDCCRNVRISNCQIETGDDCIALKSDANRLGEARPCENIVVTNCTLSSPTCAVRVGYEGDAPIRNCAFTNLSVYNTRTGIDILSVIPDKPWCMIRTGALIEGIVFENIVMNDVDRPIFIWLGKETEDPLLGRVRNIRISNVIAYAKNSSYIGGCAEADIEGVELAGIKLVMRGRIDNPDFSLPDVWGANQHPYGLFCRYVHGLKVSDLHIDWRSATGNWQNQILAENVKDMEIAGFSSEQYDSTSNLPAVHLHDVKGAFIRACRAERMNTFLHVDGSSSRDIALIGNDLSHAECASRLSGIDSGAFFETANRLPDV
jgi:hypothetical protein